jgi:hypothetical protein
MNHHFSSSLTRFSGAIRSMAACLCLALSAGLLSAASDAPANLDNGIKELISESSGPRVAIAGTQTPSGISRKAVRDQQNRVMVSIHLDGKTTIAETRAQLEAAGARVTAEATYYRSGVISAFVPVNKIADMAHAPGVLSISLGRHPIRNAGAAISGGALELRTAAVNAQGFDGTGITVGALSDSYDQATTDVDGNPLTIHAAQDVQTDDLPGTGNPNGNTDPVVVLEDSPPDPDVFDEGRAMLQIVHDIAPKAKLAFATAFVSDTDFANNIRNLRTTANCDVIVDDVFYTQEPMFSDGIIAQAVNDVATSTVLAGKKVAYFSSAGNQQGGGYLATFKPVADATVRAGLPNQNLDLTTVPPTLTSGGFHNFNPDPGAPDVSQSFIVTAQTTVEVDFQWNDPFDLPGGITTDYNILIFDASGHFVSAFSGTADNFATQEPIEDITITNSTDSNAVYQIVITRAGNSPATPVASKLRYLAIDDTGSGVGASEYYQPAAPATFGHNCSAHALGTAAYVYDDNPSVPVGPPFTPTVEDFTSQGPATIDFDSSGSRLANSEIRQKPDIAAPDGGNTTFFGDDYEGDGLPNFFGTSAAAPHAAGVAALMLNKAAVHSETLTEQDIRHDLQNSVLNPHDIDPFFSQGTAVRSAARKSNGASVHITGFGNSSNASSQDPNFFTVTFHPGKKEGYLTQLTIDLSGAGLKFDSTSDTGFPFTLGKLQGISASSIRTNVPPEDSDIRSITLFFGKKTFTGATSVSFGIDRDFIGDGGGNGADLMQNAKFFATTNKSGLSGTIENAFGVGYTILDGFGLIDAVKAVQAVP